MRFWWDYRAAWAQTRWLMPIALVGALFVVVGVVGTIAQNVVAVFFIPGLLCLIAHHMLVHQRI